jgi:hypothetical protein
MGSAGLLDTYLILPLTWPVMDKIFAIVLGSSETSHSVDQDEAENPHRQ